MEVVVVAAAAGAGAAVAVVAELAMLAVAVRAPNADFVASIIQFRQHTKTDHLRDRCRLGSAAAMDATMNAANSHRKAIAAA